MNGGMMDLLAPYFAAQTGEPSNWLLGDQGANVGGLMSLLGGKGNGGGGGGGGMGAVANVPNSSHWEDVARQMAAKKYGWGPKEFRWLDYTIAGGGPQDVVSESGWDPKAKNPTAPAYGIPQMYAPAHPDVNVKKFMANPMMQIRWLLNYVKGRYGDPRSAYQAKVRTGTY